MAAIFCVVVVIGNHTGVSSRGPHKIPDRVSLRSHSGLWQGDGRGPAARSDRGNPAADASDWAAWHHSATTAGQDVVVLVVEVLVVDVVLVVVVLVVLVVVLVLV